MMPIFYTIRRTFNESIYELYWRARYEHDRRYARSIEADFRTFRVSTTFHS